MNWWPFVTKKRHLETIARLIDEQQKMVLETSLTYQHILQEERIKLHSEIVTKTALIETVKREYEKELSDTKSLIDELLKELSTISISRKGFLPELTWELKVTIDPDLVARLRDPSLWHSRQIELKSDKATKMIVYQFGTMLEKQLDKYGLIESEEWLL